LGKNHIQVKVGKAPRLSQEPVKESAIKGFHEQEQYNFSASDKQVSMRSTSRNKNIKYLIKSILLIKTIIRILPTRS